MLNFSHPQKLRTLCFLNIIFVFWYFTYSELSINLICLSIFYSILLNLIGNNIGLHRYFSHRSFEVKNDLVLKILSTLCGLGSQVSYSMTHRQHHKFSDTIGDPHNPKEIGLFKSLTMSYKSVNINPTIVRDLFADKDLKFIHKNYYRLLSCWMLILLIFDIKYVILFFSLPMLICWISAVSIGTLPHLQGYKIFPDSTSNYNNIVASLLSMGEGWHHYHHINPKNYKHGTRWWEFDPAAKIISLIKIGKNDKTYF